MQLERQKNNRIGKLAIGSFLLLISTPCVIGMVYDLIAGTDNVLGALMAGSFFFILAIIGLFFLRLGFNTPKQDPLILSQQLEREVLHRACVHQGILSVPRLAMETNISIADAELVLQEFQTRGYARLEISPRGTLEYHFPDFLEAVVLDDLDSQIEAAAHEVYEVHSDRSTGHHDS